jgi:pyruvate dehydrogenase E1 component beta subunit
VLVVDEDYRDYGMSGEVIASIAERLGPAAPRLARHAPDVPLPANKALEESVLPGPASIASAVRDLLGPV